MSRWADLRAGRRLAAIGAAVLVGSLLFPWYGIELELFAGFSQTGIEAFGAAHAALLVTAGAALIVIWRCAGGYRPPRPLGEGPLLMVAGIWAATVIAFLAVDRPDTIAGLGPVRLRYGIFAAMGGAAGLLVGGMRLRGAEPASPANPKV